MTRIRKPVAVVCIALVLCAAILPGIAGFDLAILVPQWVLLPDTFAVAVVRPAVTAAAQPLSLRSLVPSRAPPTA